MPFPGMIARRRWLAAGLLLGAATACRPNLAAYYALLPASGAQLPPFTFPGLDGRQVSNTDLRGRPAVVAFWSSRCRASQAAVAALGRLRAEYEPRGVAVVVLAQNTSPDSVRRALDSAGAHVSVGLAGDQITRVFARHPSRWPWGARSIALPSFVVVDQSGRVVQRMVGIEAEPARQLMRLRNALDSLAPAGPPSRPAA